MAVGDRFEPEHGRPSWSDGNEEPSPENPEPLPKGYYPLNADGTVDEAVRLRWVDDFPDDDEDNRGHFEEMPREAGRGYYHGRKDGPDYPEDGPTAELAADVHGEARTQAQVPRRGLRYQIGKRKEKT
jgi:hypothetical protein